MAIIKIEQIYLYTDQVYDKETGALGPADSDSTKAIAWFAEQGITDYVNLNYSNSESHADCLTPLNSWAFIGKTEDITAFPFAYYTEVHDDLPVNNMPTVLLYGLDAIQNSNLSDLYQLGK
jgi:hypothetical protein